MNSIRGRRQTIHDCDDYILPQIITQVLLRQLFSGPADITTLPLGFSGEIRRMLSVTNVSEGTPECFNQHRRLGCSSHLLLLCGKVNLSIAGKSWLKQYDDWNHSRRRWSLIQDVLQEPSEYP